MRVFKPILAVSLVFMLALPAAAQYPTIHRSSRLGGTGMMFSRTGDQLYEDEHNAGILFEYLIFDEMALNPDRQPVEPFLDDPREEELWMTLYYNYGVTRLWEVGLQIPVVYLSEFRDAAVGRTGLDARYLILPPESSFGLGLSSTGWVNFHSFTTGTTSDEINGGFELAASLQGEAFDFLASEWAIQHLLEPMTLHTSLGWGSEDYLEFMKFFPPPSTSTPFNTRDPNNPNFINTEFMSFTFGAEFELYDRLFLGAELLTRQWPNQHTDQSCHVVFPELSYTFSGKARWTVQGAWSMGCSETSEIGRPEYLATLGLTVHFPSEQIRKEEVRPVPPPPFLPPAPLRSPPWKLNTKKTLRYGCVHGKIKKFIKGGVLKTRTRPGGQTSGGYYGLKGEEKLSDAEK